MILPPSAVLPPLAINPMYIRSSLTRIFVGMGGGEVTCAGCKSAVLELGIETLGILKMVELSSFLEVDGPGEGSLSAEARFLVVGGSMIGPKDKSRTLGAGGTLKSGRVLALKSACDLLCLTSYSSILFCKLLT